MDLAYLRAHPDQLPAFLHHQRIRETPVGGGSICQARRLTFDTGESVFAKSLPDPPPGFFAAEAHGLRWLADAGAPVPDVIAELPDLLALVWVEPGAPTTRAAEQLGRDLATLHRAGAPAFGADWPGYIGSLPLDNTPSTGRWADWFAAYRLEPYIRASPCLDASDRARLGRLLAKLPQLAGPEEAPARLHGDLWPGNVLWAADGRARLVDPAAHGGHRETDLSLLALFGGAPHLRTLLAAYQEVHPLADGWRDRVPLHQLYLLLVHTALFGGAYREAVTSATMRYV